MSLPGLSPLAAAAAAAFALKKKIESLHEKTDIE